MIVERSGINDMATRNYRVLHQTHYRYTSPVALSHQLLHLTPRALPWQSCTLHRIEVDPQPAEFREREDYFGNPVGHFVVAAPHDALIVRAQSEVRVSLRGVQRPFSDSPAWEAVRERLRQIGTAPLLGPAQYLFESPHAGASADLAAYAGPSFAGGRSLLAAALDLNRRIHQDFEFDAGATDVTTLLHEVLSRRRGVCQDFAHLMIGCLRSVGLAARYVSGYILTTPPPGRPRLVGADASHAWVSVFCPELGWVDFDPTNDRLVDAEYITLGWGRDFGDVTPMRGVILGGGGQELEVEVTVTPMDAAASSTTRG